MPSSSSSSDSRALQRRVPAAACVSRLGTAPYTCLLDGDAPAVNQDMVGENVPEQDVLVLSGNTAMTLQVQHLCVLFLLEALL